MKKIITMLFASALAIAMIFAAAGCVNYSKRKEDNSAKYQSEKGFTYNKKYIYYSYLNNSEDEQLYYVFNANGTGKYHYYYDHYDYYYGYVSSYTVSFIYRTDADGEVVYCFFDSVTYDDVDTEKTDVSSWYETLTYNKDILMSLSGSYYICEDFIKFIPNFGSTAE